MQVKTALLLLALSGTLFIVGESCSGGESGVPVSNMEQRVVVKEIPDILVAGMRMKGRYSEMGEVFKKLGGSVGRYVNGKSLALYYDREHKERDADFEPCFPVEKKVSADGITCRTLKGGKAITVIHRGPYETIREAYVILDEYRKRHGLKTRVPTREVYLKGPGRFFKGNPKNYVTEIQFLIESTSPGQ